MMAECAANYNEQLFAEPEVYRPHPYVDSSFVPSASDNETIPPVTYPEVVNLLSTKKRKTSLHCKKERYLQKPLGFQETVEYRPDVRYYG